MYIIKICFNVGAVVIDIGINRIKDKNGKTQLVGDCDFEGISQVRQYLSVLFYDCWYCIHG